MTTAEDYEGRAQQAARDAEDAAARMREAIGGLVLARVQGAATLAPPATDSGFRLGARSLQRLEGVHVDLLAVVEYAIRVSPIDFGITRTGGVRTIATQARLRGEGKSKAKHPRHVTGHAVDIAPLPGGVYSPASKHAALIHVAFVEAGEALEVPLRWGGDWDGDGNERERGENDLVHHELPRGVYGVSGESRSQLAANYLHACGLERLRLQRVRDER